jgi:hypothetical protein
MKERSGWLFLVAAVSLVGIFVSSVPAFGAPGAPVPEATHHDGDAFVKFEHVNLNTAVSIRDQAELNSYINSADALSATIDLSTGEILRIDDIAHTIGGPVPTFASPAQSGVLTHLNSLPFWPGGAR